MDAKDVEIAALKAQIAAQAAGGAAPTHPFVPKKKAESKVKAAGGGAAEAPKEKGKKVITQQGIANWALIKSGTPMRQVCKGLVWSGVFVSSTCFRLTAIDGKAVVPPQDFGSLNAFVKAQRQVLVKAGHYQRIAKSLKKAFSTSWMESNRNQLDSRTRRTRLGPRLGPTVDGLHPRGPKGSRGPQGAYGGD